MVTLGLDPVTWDLCANADGNWPTLTECEAVVQNVRTCLQICEGEWFLDSTLGINFDNATGSNLDLDLFEAEVISTILDVPAVDSLSSFSLDRNNALRRVCTNFTGVTTCGDEFGVAT